MGDVVIAAVLVLFGMGGLGLAVRAYNRRLATSLTDPADSPWTLDEHSDGELVVVVCRHPGDEDLLVGSVPWAARDFDEQIAGVRLEGELRLEALNRRSSKRDAPSSR
jgi:hypothetical protein